jgi:membrane fusion protein (multidrug efflux system)
MGIAACGKEANLEPHFRRCRVKFIERVGLIVGLTVLLSTVLLGGCQRKALPPPRPVPEVAVVTVQAQRAVLTNELPGRTSPYGVAEIRPRVSGIIQKRLFEEGADVKAGDVLYQIDPAPFQAAYDNAAANLAVTRKAADRARAVLEVSIAAVRRQKATLDLARVNGGLLRLVRRVL